MSDDFKLEADPPTPPALPSATLLDAALGERMNRRELALVRALSNVAEAADDDPPMFWFSKVMDGWLSPQSHYRKQRLADIFRTAMQVCEASNAGHEPQRPAATTERKHDTESELFAKKEFPTL